MYERVVFLTRLSAIGDVIIALNTIDILSKNGYYPVLVSSKFAEELLPYTPSLKSFICLEKDKQNEFYFENKKINLANFVKQINALSVQKKHIIIDLQKTARSRRAIKEIKNLFEIEKVFKVQKQTLYRFFLILFAFLFGSQKRRKINIDYFQIKNVAQIQMSVLSKIFYQDNLFPKSIEVRKNNFEIKPDTDLSENYVVLFPGASGFIKMWPKENFRELIKHILNNSEYSVVLCGSQSEIAIGDYLDFPKSNRVLNFINKTTLSQTLNIIAHSKYLISNDSFAGHAAHFFGIPATILFGSTSPKFGFVPKSKYIKVEYLNLSCSPCTRHGKSKCRYENLKCLKDIKPEDIFKNIINK